MVYGIEKVIRDVRVCMDQNMEDGELLAEVDADTLELDDIVRSKVVEAVERVHLNAPAERLEGGHTFGEAVYWGDRESGWVILPDDFLRLVVFEMSDWERPVLTAMRDTDPGYALQRQRVKALRGTAQRPVCVLTWRQEGRALEFYSCKSEDAFVRRGLYLPVPAVDREGGIDICERCYRAVIYAAAALVLITMGESEKAAALSEISKTALE